MNAAARVTRMLASVTTVAEAVMAQEEGVDIVDIKDPSKGALGALDGRIARDIVSAVGAMVPTSATVGDYPEMNPASVTEAVRATAELDVTYIKIGFWGTPRDAQCAQALAPLAAGHRLIAVLFADLSHESAMLETLAAAGFTGAMYDTANKAGAPLRGIKSTTELALFVRRARGLGLLCGLAGKLKSTDIEPLVNLGPDYLGFRGALCEAHARTGQMHRSTLAGVLETVRGASDRAAAAQRAS